MFFRSCGRNSAMERPHFCPLPACRRSAAGRSLTLAVLCRATGGRRFKHRHRLTLAANQVPNRGANLLAVPEIARATVPRPSRSVRPVQARPIQRPARVRLECVHHLFGRTIRIHNDVNVICSYVGCQQHPFPPLADLLNCPKNKSPPGVVQDIGSLSCQFLRIGFANFALLCKRALV